MSQNASFPVGGVNLENCDVEPIHIPGQIQPHGALLAFDLAGRLATWSANASALLQVKPVPHAHLAELGLAQEVIVALNECLAEAEESVASGRSESLSIGGSTFDLIIHRHGDRLIAEFESRAQTDDELAAFALSAHRAIDRVRRQKTVVGLLETAVADIRTLTGFDRVMAYRFRHDDSGDVVAEARAEHLEPYVGRRYPASDIPAQARRLYTINSLRLIGDVGYTPVSMQGPPGEAPLDMSLCVLRSVSPIHIEYLQNMGIGGSMSISLILNGRLWGLLACHHLASKQVPHSIRMACDVLAQVISATVQSIEAQVRTSYAERAAVTRTQLVADLLQADDAMSALHKRREEICSSLGAQALIVSWASGQNSSGAISDSLSRAIADSLTAEKTDLVERSQLSDWPESVRPLLGRWVGMLALRFDPATQGWLIALRPEQIETVRWGGQPEKNFKVGPLGPRLTPRGSFAEWRETVRGRAEPWDANHTAHARELLSELHRASNTRHVETERARTALIAMLGHDLRDPLHSITMAATVLERGHQPVGLGQRIQASSGRMQRLISQVLDMSRVQGGNGLNIRPTVSDLTSVIADVLDELRTAHPDTVYDVDMPECVKAEVDADRIAQVISNLLSNARHHGEIGSPIHLTLSADESRAIIHVRNRGQQISDEVSRDLFSAFKRNSPALSRNRTGLGLGLYITHQIIQGHGGTIQYRFDDPYVVFAVELPLGTPPQHS